MSGDRDLDDSETVLEGLVSLRRDRTVSGAVPKEPRIRKLSPKERIIQISAEPPAKSTERSNGIATPLTVTSGTSAVERKRRSGPLSTWWRVDGYDIRSLLANHKNHRNPDGGSGNRWLRRPIIRPPPPQLQPSATTNTQPTSAPTAPQSNLVSTTAPITIEPDQGATRISAIKLAASPDLNHETTRLLSIAAASDTRQVARSERISAAHSSDSLALNRQMDTKIGEAEAVTQLPTPGLDPLSIPSLTTANEMASTAESRSIAKAILPTVETSVAPIRDISVTPTTLGSLLATENDEIGVGVSSESDSTTSSENSEVGLIHLSSSKRASPSKFFVSPSTATTWTPLSGANRLFSSSLCLDTTDGAASLDGATPSLFMASEMSGRTCGHCKSLELQLKHSDEKILEQGGKIAEYESQLAACRLELQCKTQAAAKFENDARNTWQEFTERHQLQLDELGQSHQSEIIAREEYIRELININQQLELYSNTVSAERDALRHKYHRRPNGDRHRPTQLHPSAYPHPSSQPYQMSYAPSMAYRAPSAAAPVLKPISESTQQTALLPLTAPQNCENWNKIARVSSPTSIAPISTPLSFASPIADTNGSATAQL